MSDWYDAHGDQARAASLQVPWHGTLELELPDP